jgi:hypothetical protein
LSLRFALGLVAAGVLAVSSASASECFHMGSSGSRSLTQFGDLCLAFNDHCLTYGDNSGSFSVTVTLLRGGNPIAGPTPVSVDARTAPTLSDFGSGYTPGLICLGWSAMPGDVLQWTASGSVDRGGGLTGPDGLVPHSGYAYNKHLCVASYPTPIFNLAGSVGGWPYGNHSGECGGDPTPTIKQSWGRMKIIYR